MNSAAEARQADGGRCVLLQIRRPRLGPEFMTRPAAASPVSRPGRSGWLKTRAAEMCSICRRKGRGTAFRRPALTVMKDHVDDLDFMMDDLVPFKASAAALLAEAKPDLAMKIADAARHLSAREWWSQRHFDGQCILGLAKGGPRGLVARRKVQPLRRSSTSTAKPSSVAIGILITTACVPGS